jgi:hypothetical protein
MSARVTGHIRGAVEFFAALGVSGAITAKHKAACRHTSRARLVMSS